MTTPQYYMQLALKQAEQGIGTVSPNPLVGCILVKDNQIIAEGYHQAAGQPHAEINALKAAGNAAKDATLYITLEPCCHHGRTPPCTDALIKAGIKHVYVACLDPNPLVAGKGIAALKAAGITVEVGIEETAAKQLNEVFFHYIAHKRPFVIAKWAMSLDGKTVTHAKDDRKISNTTSHHHTHQMRATVDAILVGANTLIKDNPLLTARFGDENKKQPLRVILTSTGNVPIDTHVFDTTLPGKTLVFVTAAVDTTWLEQMQKKKIEVVICQQNAAGQIDLHTMLDELGKREIASLLVEGGMTVLTNFFQENLVNKINVYLAPTIISALNKKQPLKNLSHTPLDGDYFFSANLTGETHV